MATLWTDSAAPSRNVCSSHAIGMMRPVLVELDSHRHIGPQAATSRRSPRDTLPDTLPTSDRWSRHHFKARITVRVAHGRDTSPSVSTDAQQSTHCNSLGETRIFECAAGNYATALRAASYKMPNWMECEVQIIGPTDEIARFRTAHIGNDQNGELQLDFDSIIPMPPEGRGRLEMPSQQGDRIATGKSCARSNKFMVRQA